MPKLSQAAQAAVTKSTSALTIRVAELTAIRDRVTKDYDRLLVERDALERRAISAERKVLDLKKRLLAAEVKIGRHEGYLDRVREHDAKDSLPTTEQVTTVNARQSLDGNSG